MISNIITFVDIEVEPTSDRKRMRLNSAAIGLRLPEELDETVYLNPDGSPSLIGSELMIQSLVEGLTGQIHYAKTMGYREDDAAHLRECLEKISISFATVKDAEHVNKKATTPTKENTPPHQVRDSSDAVERMLSNRADALNLEKQYEVYLEGMQLNEGAMRPDERIGRKVSFMAGIFQILNTLKVVMDDDVMSDEEGAEALEGLIRQAETIIKSY